MLKCIFDGRGQEVNNPSHVNHQRRRPTSTSFIEEGRLTQSERAWPIRLCRQLPIKSCVRSAGYYEGVFEHGDPPSSVRMTLIECQQPTQPSSSIRSSSTGTRRLTDLLYFLQKMKYKIRHKWSYDSFITIPAHFTIDEASPEEGPLK